MPAADTIFALSSARGKAGVSVFRICGPRAAEAIRLLSGADVPTPRTAVLRTLKDPEGGDIDRALVLWFGGPASFTGDDTAELHVHGSRAVIDALTQALATQPGLRPAEPGEFTRRAFENGKLDLTAAEGLADLIAAETAEQRRLALRHMQGGLRDLADRWRTELIRAGAHLEACIDFPDEEIPAGLLDDIAAAIAALRKDILDHLATTRRGEIIRDGFSVAIIGAPNVGKSSLLNALARRDAAIVSATPGTTRDPVEVHMDLAGYAVTLIDTAGLRETDDVIESEGIRRTRQRAEAADMRLVVATCLGDGLDSRVTQEIREHDILVLNKQDLVSSHEAPAMPAEAQVFRVSALTGKGLDELLDWLGAQVVARAATSETIPLTRARHRHALEAVTRHLDSFTGNLGEPATGIDMLAEDLRMAARELGKLTGRIGVEDYLDVIFRDFCIGK
jgi:tRNA modification GTPase